MGAAPCVVSLSRWFPARNRGSFYGFWSASHNIGEAFTFIVVASVVSFAGWRYGFIGAGIIGLIGAAVIAAFVYDTPRAMDMHRSRAIKSPMMKIVRILTMHRKWYCGCPLYGFLLSQVHSCI